MGTRRTAELSPKLSLPAGKPGFESQQQPSRSIEEVIETRALELAMRMLGS
jgi:hypothetical protein